MLFNSFPFLLAFLPLTLGGFFLLGRRSPRAAALWLLAASLAFYAGWSVRYVPLLVGSIAFNFMIGRSAARSAAPRTRRALVALGVAANLALLGYFKYADFFLSSVGMASGWALPRLDIVLPVGISFFTFTQIAYLVDVGRGEAREYDPFHYALFVSYFPHLVAGPIIHHRQVMPQLLAPATYRVNHAAIASGLTLFCIGLAKKVLLADSLAEFATPVFDAAAAGASPRLLAAWTGALAFSLQLYFDFSGYSDMAVGLSRLIGVELPFNFASPYKAASLIEFWRRWHRTLSSFLRDYVYIPLGGNRKGTARRYANLCATMLLGGLWHGAAWTFVLWGAVHAVLLSANHAWRALRGPRSSQAASPVRHAAAVALTFAIVTAAWVLFRAASVEDALRILRGMAGLNGISLPEALQPWLPALPGVAYDGVFESFDRLAIAGSRWFVVLATIGLAIAWAAPSSQDLVERIARGGWGASRRAALACGLLLAASLAALSSSSEFLYFQF